MLDKLIRHPKPVVTESFQDRSSLRYEPTAFRSQDDTYGINYFYSEIASFPARSSVIKNCLSTFRFKGQNDYF